MYSGPFFLLLARGFFAKFVTHISQKFRKLLREVDCFIHQIRGDFFQGLLLQLLDTVRAREVVNHRVVEYAWAGVCAFVWGSFGQILAGAGWLGV